MSKEQVEHSAATHRYACACGGTARYFGEALMGSITCDKCGEYLIGVGDEFIKTIGARWQRGERGADNCEA